MKNIRKIPVLLLLLAAFTACQADFDELRDTQQRYAEFMFCTDSLFARTLLYDGSSYVIGAPATLPSDCRLRITSYCYAPTGRLVYSHKSLHNGLTSEPLRIRHLYKDQTYRFLFIADIVKHDPHVDYYETWFQMSTDRWDAFYLYADNRRDDPLYNIAATAVIEQQPDNQTTQVVLMPVTYNGYLVFRHLDAIERLAGEVVYINSIRLSTMDYISHGSFAYAFEYHSPSGEIIKPLSLSDADELVMTTLRALTVTGRDTVFIDLLNNDKRPFVATIDCEKRELENCIFY